jgi:serine/threonine protein kinase
VLEHVEGLSLAELLAIFRDTGEKLTDTAIFYIGISILEALAHAHGHLDERGEPAPVVHSAVSPVAVFLGKDGTVKLSGFALAKMLGEEPNAESGLRDASYLAPEQKLSEKVDVYAAGLLLWELLTGRSPALGIEPLSVLRRDLPREVIAAIDASIEQSTHKRTISCADMARWIQKAVHFGRGRKELRQRISALATSFDVVPPADAALSPRGDDSLFNWVLRASQAAERWVESRPFANWVDALTPGQRRAGVASAVGALLLVVFLPVARSSSRAAKGANGPRADVSAALPMAAAMMPPAMPAPMPAACPPNTPPPKPVKPTSTRSKYGFLTVHSPMRFGYVYVFLQKYGRIEDRLVVPCGRQQFISVGLPNPHGGEPAWLAPSEYVPIPCGGSTEITIRPRRLK